MGLDPSAVLLTDHVAVVTGGGSGIGAAIARRLAAGGHTVAIWDLNLASAEAVVAELGGGLALAVDVASWDAVEAATEATVKSLGVPSVLVNNAGGRTPMPLLEMTPEQWRRELSVNLDGVFYCTLAVAREMVKRGSGGAIVNMASIAAYIGGASRPGYTASKAGVVGLTRASAMDLADHGIRVNAVAPGAIATPMTAPLRESPGADDFVSYTPAARFGQPSEIAEVVAFLVGPGASFMTGSIVTADGGFTLGRRIQPGAAGTGGPP